MGITKGMITIESTPNQQAYVGIFPAPAQTAFESKPVSRCFLLRRPSLALGSPGAIDFPKHQACKRSWLAVWSAAARPRRRRCRGRVRGKGRSKLLEEESVEVGL